MVVLRLGVGIAVALVTAVVVLNWVWAGDLSRLGAVVRGVVGA